MSLEVARAGRTYSLNLTRASSYYGPFLSACPTIAHMAALRKLLAALSGKRLISSVYTHVVRTQADVRPGGNVELVSFLISSPTPIK